MNVIDMVVIHINSKPYKVGGKWFVDVTGTAYGTESPGSVMFDTEEEALALQVGHVFQA